MKKTHLAELGFNLFNYDPNKLEASPQAECFKLGKKLEVNKMGHIVSGIFQYKDNNLLFCVFYSEKILLCVADPSCLNLTKTIIEIGNSMEYDEKPDTSIINELIIFIIKNYKDKNLTGFYW